MNFLACMPREERKLSFANDRLAPFRRFLGILQMILCYGEALSVPHSTPATVHTSMLQFRRPPRMQRHSSALTMRPERHETTSC